jgi:transcriptional regulator GlxA family with amidase domain
MRKSPHKIRHVALLAFDGIQILDITGPAAVFGAANDAAGRRCYAIHILSAKGGAVTSNSGVELMTAPLSSLKPSQVDTALIAGGNKEGLQSVAMDKNVRAWMAQASAHARRYGSICTGTFPLAYFGLIRGKRVATHWQATSLLGKYYPDVEVDANALYVEDGRVWTSAGVTTGIDMCLAIVARDVGDQVANAVAKRLVLYARRPGYQSQFSPVLAAQEKADTSFSKLIDWIREHLAEPLDVACLAERAAMSTRNFHRKFTEAIGETPAHFVETLRLDQARHLLATATSLKDIAARTGYATPGQFSKAFVRRFGMSPGLFREVHRS